MPSKQKQEEALADKHQALLEKLPTQRLATKVAHIQCAIALSKLPQENVRVILACLTELNEEIV